MAESLRDRIVGGLLGVAAGDALGAAVEFMTPVRIRQEHGVHCEIVGGGAFGWRAGQGADDTDLTWAVIDGYLDTNGGDSIAHSFLAWFATSPRDVGGTTSGALTQLRESTDPSTSGLSTERSCGNGSLMRALPMALVRADAERRRAESAQIYAITHAHRRCVDSCVAYNEIAAAIIAGSAVGEAMAEARSLDLDPEVRTALDTPPEVSVSALSTSCYVIDSLSCAVWAVQQAATLESVLVALVNRGDDADTTAAIAGGLLGIVHGEAAIPKCWSDQLEYAPRLIEAAAHIEAIRLRSQSERA